jgi:hypothetical protein
VDLAEIRHPLRQQQQFIQRNRELIIRWYQHDHLSWPVIAARLNQCLRGGGISTTLLQSMFPHVRRLPRAAEVPPAEWMPPSGANTQIEMLEERLLHQQQLLAIQQEKMCEAIERRARLEELTGQLLPLLREAQNVAERLPRSNPNARELRERLLLITGLIEGSQSAPEL